MDPWMADGGGQNNIRQAMAWNYDHYFAGMAMRDVQIHHG